MKRAGEPALMLLQLCGLSVAVAALVKIHTAFDGCLVTAANTARRAGKRLEMVLKLASPFQSPGIALSEANHTVVVKHWYTSSDWIAESALVEWYRCNKNQKNDRFMGFQSFAGLSMLLNSLVITNICA